MREEKFDLCGYCCEWQADHKHTSPQKAADDYPKMMRKVLKHRFHMGRKAADGFVDDACSGNWERLHKTAMEKYASAEDYLELLCSEVFYCSDRWSWDRVMRVQWLYKAMKDAIWREASV